MTDVFEEVRDESTVNPYIEYGGVRTHAVSPQMKVDQFHQVFGAYRGVDPAIPPIEEIHLREELIEEEYTEVVEALDNLEDMDSIAELAKELADLLYVVYGTAVTFGINLDAVFDEVHRSNMSKVWEDGQVHYREDGKVLKPPEYEPPDIKSVF